MAEQLQSCIRRRRPTSSLPRTAFALYEGEDSDNFIQVAKRESCISQDSQVPQGSTPSKENIDENTNSNAGSLQESSIELPPLLKPIKVSYKPKQRGKVQQQPRTICVHLYNRKRVHLTFTFNAAEVKPVLRVQLVKDSLAKVLNVAPDVLHMFGVLSGSVECPTKLFRDDSSLPEGISHFTLQLLGLQWDDRQSVNKSGMKLIASEIRSHSEYDCILPPLNKEEKEIVSESNSTDSLAISTLVKTHSFSTISTLVKTHSFSTSNEAYGQPFPSLTPQNSISDWL